MEGFENRPLFFVYAPPLKGVRKSKRNELQPPYAKAPPWECSVYYWWWAYLRRHDGYRKTCEQGGRGKYKKLYADFGDIYATDFWPWWREHAYLFAEPKPRQVEELQIASKDPTLLTLQIPLENKESLTVRQIKRLLAPRINALKQRKTQSKAMYPVATKPVLPSIYMHLCVWDAHTANPDLSDVEIADLVNVPINTIVDGMAEDFAKKGKSHRSLYERTIYRRKQLAVQRHLRIARQYIDNVGKGAFPLRSSR